MFSTISYLSAGFIVLYLGAEWLVNGSASLAKATGIRPVVIALTIVAFGTSAPEFVVSINAAIHKSSDIAVGNILGSMIANIGLVLGLSALIRPLKIEFRLLKKEVPILIVCEALFLIFAWDSMLSRLDGAILLAGFIVFNWYCIREAVININERKGRIDTEYKKYISRRKGSKGYNLFLLIIGIIALLAGSHLVIKGAVEIANIFGVSRFVIAASLVAVGTSLPELATSTVAAARGEFDISIGNILGSNIFNILMCIGLAALISPLGVERQIVRQDTLIMIGLSLLLGLFMWTRRRIGRLEGLFLLLAYGGYLIFLFRRV